MLATVGSLAAGVGQFRWRSWSIAVAKAGSWLAFCSSGILALVVHDARGLIPCCGNHDGRIGRQHALWTA